MTDQKYPYPESGDSAATPLKRAIKSPKKTSANLTKMRLLNTCSGAFFCIGAYGLIDPQSILQWLEVAVVGFAGGYAAYSINHICTTKGAYQAATGVAGATPACLVTMGAMGLTISIASLTGMTINAIDQMRLQNFGNENTIYVEERIASARHADEVVVAVESAFEQIQAASKCERASSCVSRNGNGGKGLAYFTLKGAETQIGTVLQKLKDGSKVRDEALLQIEESEEDVLAALNAVNPSRKARRAKVQKHVSVQNKALAALDRAQPLSLVSGLAEELQRGVDLPSKPVLSQRINERLSKASKGIVKALEQVGLTEAKRPKMPPETGVLETLGWIGHFLPLAAMLVLIDTVFPILLWFFTFSALRQTVEPETDPDDDDPFGFSAVAEIPPVQIKPASRSPHRTNNRKRNR